MDLKDLMGMKSSAKKPKDDAKRKAKMEVIDELRKMASDMMGEGLHDKLSKVTVAAKNPKSLEKGLEMAQDIIGKGPKKADSEYKPEDMMDEEEASEYPEESMADDQAEEEEMTPEEIDQKIEELMKLKEKMS